MAKDKGFKHPLEALGIGQVALAHEVGLKTRNQVARWISGRDPIPDSKLAILHDRFRVDIDKLRRDQLSIMHAVKNGKTPRNYSLRRSRTTHVFAHPVFCDAPGKPSPEHARQSATCLHESLVLMLQMIDARAAGKAAKVDDAAGCIIRLQAGQHATRILTRLAAVLEDELAAIGDRNAIEKFAIEHATLHKLDMTASEWHESGQAFAECYGLADQWTTIEAEHKLSQPGKPERKKTFRRFKGRALRHLIWNPSSQSTESSCATWPEGTSVNTMDIALRRARTIAAAAKPMNCKRLDEEQERARKIEDRSR